MYFFVCLFLLAVSFWVINGSLFPSHRSILASVVFSSCFRNNWKVGKIIIGDFRTACSDLERRLNFHIAQCCLQLLQCGSGWLERPPESSGYHSIYTKVLGALQCQEAAWIFVCSSSSTFSEDCRAIVRGYKVGTAFPPDRSFSLQDSLEANFIKYHVADPKHYK